MASSSKVTPWVDWDEWLRVRRGLFGVEELEQRNALSQIDVWRSRGRVPLAVEASAQLLQLAFARAARSRTELQLAYSAVIVRAVNGLVDPCQRGAHASSVSGLARHIGLPAWLVDVRHCATHKALPSLPILSLSADTLLQWLRRHYWDAQNQHLLHARAKVRTALRSYMLSTRASSNAGDSGNGGDGGGGGGGGGGEGGTNSIHENTGNCDALLAALTTNTPAHLVHDTLIPALVGCNERGEENGVVGENDEKWHTHGDDNASATGWLLAARERGSGTECEYASITGHLERLLLYCQQQWPFFSAALWLQLVCKYLELEHALELRGADSRPCRAHRKLAHKRERALWWTLRLLTREWQWRCHGQQQRYRQRYNSTTKGGRRSRGAAAAAMAAASSASNWTTHARGWMEEMAEPALLGALSYPTREAIAHCMGVPTSGAQHLLQRLLPLAAPLRAPETPGTQVADESSDVKRSHARASVPHVVSAFMQRAERALLPSMSGGGGGRGDRGRAARKRHDRVSTPDAPPMKMQKLGQSFTESPARDTEQVPSVLDLDAMEGLLKEADGQSPAVPDSNAATAPELACESAICRQWTPCALWEPCPIGTLPLSMRNASFGSGTTDGAGSRAGLASHADGNTLPTTAQFVAMNLFVTPVARTTAAIAQSSMAALAPLAQDKEQSSRGMDDSIDLHNFEVEALDLGHEHEHDPGLEDGQGSEYEDAREDDEQHDELKKRQKHERRQARIAAVQAGIHIL